jgi:hypothetical protein
MKLQTKSSLNCTNSIKECTTFNIYITTFKPNKVSTSISKDKLDLVEGIVGASHAIFMRKLEYINNIFDRIDHTDPCYFNVSQNFVALNFHDHYPFGKLQMHLEDMIEITI